MVPEKSYFEFSLDFEIDYESNSTEDICPVSCSVCLELVHIDAVYNIAVN